MPLLLFWAVPAATIVGGYYLVTAAKVMDAALALAIPTKTPSDRRRSFRVIHGGRVNPKLTRSTRWFNALMRSLPFGSQKSLQHFD